MSIHTHWFHNLFSAAQASPAEDVIPEMSPNPLFGWCLQSNDGLVAYADGCQAVIQEAFDAGESEVTFTVDGRGFKIIFGNSREATHLQVAMDTNDITDVQFVSAFRPAPPAHEPRIVEVLEDEDRGNPNSVVLPRRSGIQLPATSQGAAPGASTALQLAQQFRRRSTRSPSEREPRRQSRQQTSAQNAHSRSWWDVKRSTMILWVVCLLAGIGAFAVVSWVASCCLSDLSGLFSPEIIVSLGRLALYGLCIGFTAAAVCLATVVLKDAVIDDELRQSRP